MPLVEAQQLAQQLQSQQAPTTQAAALPAVVHIAVQAAAVQAVVQAAAVQAVVQAAAEAMVTNGTS